MLSKIVYIIKYIVIEEHHAAGFVLNVVMTMTKSSPYSLVWAGFVLRLNWRINSLRAASIARFVFPSSRTRATKCKAFAPGKQRFSEGL